MNKKALQPRDIMIEKVALEFAAVWYEIGRGQGLTSKYKTAREYANANMEKFLPKAIKHLIECLGPNSTLPAEAKEEIYDCLMDRVNDPDTDLFMHKLPQLDMQALLDMRSVEQKQSDHVAQLLNPDPPEPLKITTGNLKSSTVSVDNPFKAQRH